MYTAERTTPIIFWNWFRIHTAFQPYIPKVIEWARSNSNILEVKVFGSAVTTHIHHDSDLDIWCRLKEIETLQKPDVSCALDLITNFDSNNELQKNIEKYGVTVYDRELNR